jgi:hypothetical protein
MRTQPTHPRLRTLPGRLALWALTATLLAGAPQARATETEDQLWPEVDVYVKMASTTRLFLQVAPQRERYASDFDKEQFGIYIETAVLKFGLRHHCCCCFD